MNSMGYCVSYTELHKFLTSAAKVSSRNPNIYLPPQIVPRYEGGKFILGAADNWDHNERTIDGKRTTHAMTSILVQQQSQAVCCPRIPREGSRTLDPETVAGKIPNIVFQVKVLKYTLYCKW